ncbi:uncharacterized protein KY384_000531 [Bacidia gigantensis]|uniref:uncharacterized protein n=1 Tax=Bacidia gigantensis TaxID=2732470 RepID=UPI001D03F519|nr:uncharacterized protein KY384_000531 [Bacidia gigantensis]KAG8525771.1 hypothetical protein KY384_000531 [Bacidia gigantensis]
MPAETIPEAFVEELKKRELERDGEDDEGRQRKRVRADTITLLEPEDKHTEVEEVTVIQPEKSLDLYSHKRLQRGLRYINAEVKRDITPRTREVLKLAKDAYKIALESEELDLSACAVVQAYDRVYYSPAFYLRSDTSEDKERSQLLLQLRRWEFLANYGDYAAEDLKNFRDHLKTAAGRDQTTELWNASRALSSKKSWQEMADEIARDVGGLRGQVFIASDALGLDPNHMLWLISEYGQRNEMFHNNASGFIKKCHWTDLAQQLHRDLTELPHTMTDNATIENYTKVINRIMHEYFLNADVTRDPKEWFPNSKAWKLSEDKSRLEDKQKGKEKQ